MLCFWNCPSGVGCYPTDMATAGRPRGSAASVLPGTGRGSSGATTGSHCEPTRLPPRGAGPRTPAPVPPGEAAGDEIGFSGDVVSGSHAASSHSPRPLQVPGPTACASLIRGRPGGKEAGACQ